MHAKKYFGSTIVDFLVEEDGEVEFRINGSLDKSTTTSRIAITKWLLCQFKLAQKCYETLHCTSYADDGYGEMRTRIYKKLGFKDIGEVEGLRLLEWTGNYKERLQEFIDLL